MQKAKKNKERFQVQENETIDECLKRIKDEGYMPVKRIEKPVFIESLENGEKTQKVSHQQITFEAIKAKHER